MYALGPCISNSNELDIPLLVTQVRSSMGIGFQPRSQINNNFDIFLRSLYVLCRLCTKSKHFFQFQQKTEIKKMLPGLREPITSLSDNYIYQNPPSYAILDK